MDTDLRARLRAQLDRLNASTTTDVGAHSAATPHSHLQQPQQQPQQEEEEETELRLFADPTNAAPQSHKIRLSSPGAANTEPGFLLKKPHSYYFASDPTSQENLALHAAAIDGQTVLELAKHPWPGCALPWKVRVLPLAGTRKAMLLARPPTLHSPEDKARKRARKGKKTRIAIRKRLQATKEMQEAQAKLAQEKEAADREKRARRNREKKLKKRAKGQAKKLAAGGEGEGEDEGEGGGAANAAEDTNTSAQD